jgi:hypothetical protein
LNPLRIAWLGEQGGGLQWLHQRLQSFSSARVPSVIVQTLDNLPANCGVLAVDRLVVGSRNRLSYPLREIEQLQRELPEVPLALATDSQWDGAGRTGLSAGLSHLVLPWHRWWDGWVDWLDGTVPTMFGPCPVAQGWLSSRRIANASLARGIVLADCRQSGEAWRLVGKQVTEAVQSESLSKFLASNPSSDAPADWLLWDEPYRISSAFSRRGNAPRAHATVDRDAWVVEQFRSLAQRLPETHMVLAVSIPRWDQWSALQAAGVHDMLTKPSTGRALQRLMSQIASQSADCGRG